MERHLTTTDPTNLAGKPQGVEGLPKAVWLRGDVHKHQAGMKKERKKKTRKTNINKQE